MTWEPDPHGHTGLGRMFKAQEELLDRQRQQYEKTNRLIAEQEKAIRSANQQAPRSVSGRPEDFGFKRAKPKPKLDRPEGTEKAFHAFVRPPGLLMHAQGKVWTYLAQDGGLISRSYPMKIEKVSREEHFNRVRQNYRTYWERFLARAKAESDQGDMMIAGLRLEKLNSNDLFLTPRLRTKFQRQFAGQIELRPGEPTERYVMHAKYQFVDVAKYEAHLRSFIAAFVIKDGQHRRLKFKWSQKELDREERDWISGKKPFPPEFAVRQFFSDHIPLLSLGASDRFCGFYSVCRPAPNEGRAQKTGDSCDEGNHRARHHESSVRLHR